MFLGLGSADTASHRLGYSLPARVRMGVLSRPSTRHDGAQSRHGVGLMSQYVFKMPDLGEGTVDAEIVAWHTKPGDAVTEDQLIVEVMTDKAAVEVPAPVSGRVLSITGAPGDKVAVGSPLIVFDVSEGDGTPAAPVASSAASTAAVAVTRKPADAPARVAAPMPAAAPVPPARQRLVMALTRVLESFPQCNVLYDAERGVLVRHRAVHVGIATQTPDGLKVPVVRNAQSLGLWEVAAAIRRLAERARNNKATRDELVGSTITVTSLGKLGGIASTPIINAPEVAIIGLNKAIERPVVHHGAVAVRRIMNLSSSFDHRFVDGYDAAAMIQTLKDLLEHPATIFIPKLKTP